MTLLPGERVTIGVRGWRTPDAETARSALYCVEPARMTASPTPRVTIKDVAARAGVSKGAVSLAFNHKPGLAEATRDRIFTAARELGWEPNLTARSLAGSRVDVVGLAICRPARLLGLEPFYMEFISGVESVLTERACSLLLRLVRTLEEEVGLQESWWRGRQIGGSILVDLRADDPRVAGRRAARDAGGRGRASVAHRRAHRPCGPTTPRP